MTSREKIRSSEDPSRVIIFPKDQKVLGENLVNFDGDTTIEIELPEVSIINEETNLEKWILNPSIKVTVDLSLRRKDVNGKQIYRSYILDIHEIMDRKLGRLSIFCMISDMNNRFISQEIITLDQGEFDFLYQYDSEKE